MRVVATSGYERRVSRLLTPAERAAAEIEIALAPLAWPVIVGTGGARKARAARGGKGERGGARIIYYVLIRRDVVYLLDVCAKGAKEDLTDADKKEIRQAALAEYAVTVPERVDVAALRKSLGLSQHAFAQQFGLDVTAIHAREQGGRHPDRCARPIGRDREGA